MGFFLELGNELGKEIPGTPYLTWLFEKGMTAGT
jgi:hypothetical protein